MVLLIGSTHGAFYPEAFYCSGLRNQQANIVNTRLLPEYDNGTGERWFYPWNLG
jgi:hypothetical protein